MFDFTTYTDAELDEALNAARYEMTVWGRISFAATSARGRREAITEHDAAQDMALQIGEERAAR
jgi:hypothetical protein